jgi:hypothetical protein
VFSHSVPYWLQGSFKFGLSVLGQLYTQFVEPYPKHGGMPK